MSGPFQTLNTSSSTMTATGRAFDYLYEAEGDGVEDTFLFGISDADTSELGHLVTTGGVVLNKDADYIISASDIVFGYAPALGEKILVRINRTGT